MFRRLAAASAWCPRLSGWRLLLSLGSQRLLFSLGSQRLLLSPGGRGTGSNLSLRGWRLLRSHGSQHLLLSLGGLGTGGNLGNQHLLLGLLSLGGRGSSGDRSGRGQGGGRGRRPVESQSSVCGRRRRHAGALAFEEASPQAAEAQGSGALLAAGGPVIFCTSVDELPCRGKPHAALLAR